MVATKSARMVVSEHPVRWFMIDNAVSPRLEWSVPPADATGPDGKPLWVGYDNDCESGKRATRELGASDLAWANEVLDSLHDGEMLGACKDAFGFAGEPDPFLHGGGLHVTRPGGFLNCHLDYSRHPHLLGKRRAVNIIVFCHAYWERAWGGLLYLADPMGEPVILFEPKPGRLVAFETNDLSYHGVTKVTGPAERVSIATYLLTDASDRDTRKRALFMPNRKPQ